MKNRILSLTIPLEKAEKAFKCFASLAGAEESAWLNEPSAENALALIKEGYKADTWEYKVGAKVDATGRIYTPSGICLSVSKDGLVVKFNRPSLVCASDIVAECSNYLFSGDDIIAHLEGVHNERVESLLNQLKAELTPAE